MTNCRYFTRLYIDKQSHLSIVCSYPLYASLVTILAEILPFLGIKAIIANGSDKDTSKSELNNYLVKTS